MSTPAPLPAVSVIVPAHVANTHLHAALDALSVSTGPSWECIVVDDGAGAAAELAAARGYHALRTTRPSGPAVARNLGAAHARAEVLFFVDSDVVVRPYTVAWVHDFMTTHTDVAAIFGSYDDSPPHRGFASQFKNLSHHFVHQHGRPEASTFWAGCGAIRRHVFADIGGFDETYDRPSIEDIELGYRLRHHGHRIVLCPQLQVTHLKEWTLPAVLKSDLLDRGIPWVVLSLRTPAGFVGDLNLSWTQRLCVALAWVGAACAALAPWHSWFGLLALGAIAAIVGLNAPLFAWLTRHRGWVFALASVPLHLLYHLSNGLAVILGTIAHATRKPHVPRLRIRSPRHH